MAKKTENISSIGIVEISDYIPSFDEEKKILDFTEQAEKDISEKRQTSNVNFRWSEFEIKRAKRIAEKLGMPYQTYIKSVLKQAMDNDELKFM